MRIRKPLNLINNGLCKLFDLSEIGSEVYDFEVLLDEVGEIPDVLCSLELVTGYHHDRHTRLL